MKVLHLPYTWYPDPIGGTEAYVEDLIEPLRELGVESVIAAAGATEDAYAFNSTSVYRLSTSESVTISDLYGREDAQALSRFKEVMAKEAPDVVHFHALSQASSPAMVEYAASEAHAVVTYHTPTFSCARGDLRRLGRTTCDGRLDVTRCGTCFLHSHGLPVMPSAILARLPLPVGRMAGRRLNSRAELALRTREVMALYHSSFRRVLTAADAVVVLAAWTAELVELAGTDSAKIRLIRHGVPLSGVPEPPPPSYPLRIVFAGRAHPTKGLDVLLDAMRLIPAAEVELDVYLPEPDVLAVQPDHRIRFHTGLRPNAFRALLPQCHVVVVPSLCLETGPLIVLEAFAAGRPVLGSALGGIAEMVDDGVDGWLLPPGDATAWAAAIERLSVSEVELRYLTSGVCPPRTTEEMAREIVSVYQAIKPRRARPRRVP